MTTSRILLVYGLALFYYITESELFAQAGKFEGPQCFAIRVRLNGKAIDSPQIIALKTKNGESMASLEGNCFNVPPAVLKEEVVDVSFTIPKNIVYLSTISTDFLAGPWDVDLQDKRFPQDIVIPKNARVSEMCAVVFHVGEPERGIVQTGCRKRL
jgi:hypothetical protein